ncbi:hypothetical protein FA15DRAFT_390506 [Coprinopsis marcescibilis]|uniref:Uncharacterized protein n=1 Tax=Coprinopsis marcescibilis TaxID=230819 RepID=A0A5C3KXD9_COPMA|nr:hypothetical protein FA15DRAFT_390506 [Coprinopsis marcescibilis]
MLSGVESIRIISKFRRQHVILSGQIQSSLLRLNDCIHLSLSSITIAHLFMSLVPHCVEGRSGGSLIITYHEAVLFSASVRRTHSVSYLFPCVTDRITRPSSRPKRQTE